MTQEEMIAGNYFRLIKKVEHEHQDHWFTYPQGLLLRLSYISEEEDLYDEWRNTEDGPIHYYGSKGKYKLNHFDTADGCSYVFNPEDLVPATKQEFDTSKVRISIVACRW